VSERERRTTVAENLDRVRARIAAAAANAGRDLHDVTLVVVTKEIDVVPIRDAYAAGARDLGENRAQELLAKAPLFARDDPPPRWHFIGRLQRNKVRALAPHVALWHSVDRVELGRAIAAHAPGARVLVQVNVAGEEQKGGCPPDEVPGLVDALRMLGLDVPGLMTVPPLAGDPRPHFATLRTLASRLGLHTLSMGMSGDFEQAVAEGATIVRVGSAVFGPRPGQTDVRR
jgi:pyridoxal phosphate enzyme (YggS family)